MTGFEKITKVDILSGWRRKFLPDEITLLSIQLDALIYWETINYIQMIKLLLEDGENYRLSESIKQDAMKLVNVKYKFKNNKR